MFCLAASAIVMSNPLKACVGKTAYLHGVPFNKIAVRTTRKSTSSYAPLSHGAKMTGKMATGICENGYTAQLLRLVSARAACMAHLLVVDTSGGLQVEAALHREAEHAHHIEVLASCTPGPSSQLTAEVLRPCTRHSDLAACPMQACLASCLNWRILRSGRQSRTCEIRRVY